MRRKASSESVKKIGERPYTLLLMDGRQVHCASKAEALKRAERYDNACGIEATETGELMALNHIEESVEYGPPNAENLSRVQRALELLLSLDSAGQSQEIITDLQNRLRRYALTGRK